MGNSYDVLKDADGIKIVIINDIRFKGKRNGDEQTLQGKLS